MTAGPGTGFTSYDITSDTEITITRIVDAPRTLVFDAWTNPAHLPKWLTGPPGWSMPVCELDLRPGGKWRYVFRKDTGDEMTLSGTVREVLAPERLVTTERWGPEWPETINTIVLSETAGQTKIVLTVTYPSRDARDAALASGMKEGMEQTFANLDALLASVG